MATSAARPWEWAEKLRIRRGRRLSTTFHRELVAATTRHGAGASQALETYSATGWKEARSWSGTVHQA